MKFSLQTLLHCSILLSLIIFSMIVASASANADIMQKDVQVVLRTLGFLQTPPSGRTDLAIIYDPAIPASVLEAGQLEQILKNGMAGKNITLFPKSVPISALGNLNKGDFVFVTGKMQNHYRAIAERARAQSMLSFSMDRSCVDQGYCDVYFSTVNRVEIIINKSAIAETKIEFNPVFLMMVTVM